MMSFMQMPEPNESREPIVPMRDVVLLVLTRAVLFAWHKRDGMETFTVEQADCATMTAIEFLCWLETPGLELPEEQFSMIQNESQAYAILPAIVALGDDEVTVDVIEWLAKNARNAPVRAKLAELWHEATGEDIE